jgi:hypothetical protein
MVETTCEAILREFYKQVLISKFNVYYHSFKEMPGISKSWGQYKNRQPDGPINEDE